jgi:hypothetical protein
MILSDEKFGSLLSMLRRLCDSFDKNPQLIQLVAHAKILTTLMSALAVLGPKSAIMIVEILKIVCNNQSKLPTKLLDLSSEFICT